MSCSEKLTKQRPRYSLRQDNNDWRDLSYTPSTAPLKAMVDMRPWASPVEDQLHLGSCTANAVVGNYELQLNKDYKDRYADLSKLYVYYNARLISKSTDEDSGAYIRDGIKSVQKYGVCTEKLWPYNISKFTEKPSDECYSDAANRLIKNYFRVSEFNDILDALSNDKPVVIGLLVYESFDEITFQNNTIYPPSNDESPLGGHAVLLVGYDMLAKRLLARNSFGINWGMNGYFWIDFEYAKNEIMDSWVFDIELVVAP
jgi:C1A family cysteine protease